ncbi:NAD(P)/FAD-dependent oxidoreductase [Nocardiopsis suaedae]|uniref:Tryptophan 7-halogenase n=1 Tax=Nocardiopsis suaedae TaxID=3018444 RepID=A0ABT4TJA2_9ACTN|nr:tryptophan 7-halogenase [Nocardiopsis suaedae]MDA2804773.1 tryptophan 7-halogenase [Nocardiopsis suaedae]
MTSEAQSRVGDLSPEQRAMLVKSLRRRIGRPADGPSHYDVVILGGGAAGLTLALQLHRTRPGTRIAVAERQRHPVPETAHKVGESTVEVAAHYLRDVLGLHDHLQEQQIRKFGLRMFFSSGDNTDIARRVELGSSAFPPLSTYQLDRGRLENELGRRCRAAGIDFLPGGRVLRVDLAEEGEAHHVRLRDDQGERSLHAAWVVDATGRNRLLQRRLGLGKDVGHTANAAWLRVGAPIDVGTWTSDPIWHARIAEGDRALSTNHLMGPGYWVWLIALSSGATSVGIVADARTHPFEEFNTLDGARAWLRRHEPQCADALEEHRDEIRDFRVMRDYSYSAEQVFDGQARWCLTGEAGIFLDPLYSPGLDLIAIGNGLITDLVTRALDGEDVRAAAGVHDSLFRRIAEIWLALYEDQYALMGHPRVMTSKVIWDTAFYWAVFGLLFFQDGFRRLTDSRVVAETLSGRLTGISDRVQAFFREWASVDDAGFEPRFVDLYSPLDFMVELHSGMADTLTPERFEERFAANAHRLAQLAGQLISAVIDAQAARPGDDRAVAMIQRWQRDPLIAELLAVYRRERHRDPTSDGWITVRPPRTGPPAAGPEPAPAPEHDRDENERHHGERNTDHVTLT